MKQKEVTSKELVATIEISTSGYLIKECIVPDTVLIELLEEIIKELKKD